MTDSNKKEKTVSLLSKLLKEHADTGGKLPAKKEAGALIKAYDVARRNSAEAKKAFDAAKQVESDAAMAMVLAFGKRKVALPDGSEVRPMSRGERVYYRGLSEDGEVVRV